MDSATKHSALLPDCPKTDCHCVGTRVTSSLGCVRKAVLEERFPGTSNAKAVEGTLLHDLLQVQLSVHGNMSRE